MSSTPSDHGHDHDHGADPVTDHVHENSWSANLEGPEHAEDRDLLVRQAIEAVEHTAAGNHVNLVTHGDHGHPEEYLFEALESQLGGDIDPEYVEQCGCGGHVVRVDV
ncbi:CGCGG family putative rSAM-modified RiPP protein [Halorubrum sp. AS12]|uniref:CGCGG family putative rSAM-modified RiPP protein n=1 Tax=Halorubrum sp. AS12 TaxID=3409687 RepID=UPI003DA72758